MSRRGSDRDRIRSQDVSKVFRDVHSCGDSGAGEAGWQAEADLSEEAERRSLPRGPRKSASWRVLPAGEISRPPDRLSAGALAVIVATFPSLPGRSFSGPALPARFLEGVPARAPGGGGGPRVRLHSTSCPFRLPSGDDRDVRGPPGRRSIYLHRPRQGYLPEKQFPAVPQNPHLPGGTGGHRQRIQPHLPHRSRRAGPPGRKDCPDLQRGGPEPFSPRGLCRRAACAAPFGHRKA